MNFLEAPLTTGIVFYFIYLTFELFARRDERLKLIEKMGLSTGSIDSSTLKSQFGTLLPSFKKKSFTALRMGCLFVGLGLGLLIGLFICLYIKSVIAFDNWERDSLYSISYSAPVLIFGGLGLIISFLLEKKDIKNDEK